MRLYDPCSMGVPERSLAKDRRSTAHGMGIGAAGNQPERPERIPRHTGTGTAGPLVRLAFPPRGRGSVVWPRREELTARAAGAGVRAG
jgi:hypothetical protein